MNRVRPYRIAVCGPGQADATEEATAEELGRRIAEAGCALVCGGLGGAMAAACRGAKAAGGTTIGILPGTDAAAANRWVDYPICTGMGQGRNVIVVATADAIIAAGGGVGTLSEIAHALRLGRPVVLLGGWAAVLTTPDATALVARQGGRVAVAETPERAVQTALRLLDEGDTP